MALILVCHGAWSGGWSWSRMREPLRAYGHEIIAQSYTGLGERTHLVNPMIDLEMHIRDMLAIIEYEDLRGFVLLGHSYGGMVATGVADRASARISEIIYLDAFVPENGQSVFDLRPETAEAMRRQAAVEGDGWFIPPMAMPTDLTEEDRAWVGPRRSRLPIKTFEQRIRLAGNAGGIAKSYIYCRNKEGRDDPFRSIGDRVRGEPGWRYFEMDSGHTPNITRPQALAALIDGIIAGTA